MSAETILRKVERALRNETGISFTADQVCELVDFGILDTLTDIVNRETKSEARARLERSRCLLLENSGNRKPHLTREAIEELCRNA